MSSRAQQRKEKRQKPASGGVKRLYLILGGVGLIGVVAAVYTTGSTVFSNAVTEPVDLGDLSDEELVNLAHGSELGDPDAPISVVEFGDYQCPGCAMFASGVKPLIELNLVNTGGRSSSSTTCRLLSTPTRFWLRGPLTAPATRTGSGITTPRSLKTSSPGLHPAIRSATSLATRAPLGWTKALSATASTPTGTPAGYRRTCVSPPRSALPAPRAFWSAAAAEPREGFPATTTSPSRTRSSS